MRNEFKLEYYVMKHDFNKNEIYQFNIFDNYYVYNGALKAVVQYMAGTVSYDEYVKELRSVIMHEMWSRCQYEIAVGGLFENNTDKFKKVDVFYQVEKNMHVIAMYVYMTAKDYFYNEDIMNTEIKAEAQREHVWIDDVKDQVFSSKEKALAAVTEDDLYDAGYKEKDRYMYEYHHIKEYISKY